jgi:hypothetical protein
MKELGIFVDESGSFGAFEKHSPLYIITLVFHDQAVDISPNLQRQRDETNMHGIPDCVFHAGPLIRRDGDYKAYKIEERMKLLTAFLTSYNLLKSTDKLSKTSSQQLSMLSRLRISGNN